MKKCILLFLVILLFNCSLTEPCTLIIENKSDYEIDISVDDGNKSNITLKKNKGEYILVSPGEVKIKVNIKSINFSKDYLININYLEKKKFIFNTN